MTAVRFSVVIPAYNSASFIGETLESLAAQTCRDFETVIVDDRSDDQTAELARNTMASLGLKGTVLVRPPSEQKGVSTCRNIGLNASTGEWIAFLDSDDLFAPEKLERITAALEYARGKARAIFHQSRRFADPSGQTLEVVPRRQATDRGAVRWLLDEVLVGNFHATCGMVIERALLREVGGFHTGLYGVEDWWLAIQISARTPWLFIEETLAHIRVRSSSLMTNAPFEHYVRQHLALVSVARRSRGLSDKHVDTLRRYSLGPLTQYFAGLAFQRGGWRALAPGVWRLLQASEVRAAFGIVHRHVRARLLVRAASTVRVLRSPSSSTGS
jgi:glycosyltransferase involved in cell wall biosynthesis